MNNFAFIDAQNLYRGIKSLGWEIDWHKFRVYLEEKYNVKSAYLFIGYIEKNIHLYNELTKSNFILIYKPIVFDNEGKIKGNCDADLVLHALLKSKKYLKAVIVTSDGDFYSLVKYLYDVNKLCAVLSPHVEKCSKLLKFEAKEKIYYMDNLRNKIGKNEKAPHED